MVLKKIYQIFLSGLTFLRSARLAIILLILVFLSSILGAILPSALGREIIFSSLWFNFLLVLLVVNILFCTLRRVKALRRERRGSAEDAVSSPWTPFVFIRGVNSRSFVLLGSLIFHFSFILLFLGVIYDNLFFFEGGIRLTEGETLSCSDEQNYDWIKKGKFFSPQKLKDLGEIYLHKLYPYYYFKGDYKGVANKIILRTKSNKKEGIIYVNSPLKYKRFEFYRDVDGHSPLFVFRDRWGRVLDGSYVPLHAVKRPDGSFNYTGGFPFPQGNPFFYLWSVYYPATKEEKAKFFLEIKQIPSPNQIEEGRKLFKGKVSLKEMVPVGFFLVSVDEVRYWSKMKVIYRPGVSLIFFSFWLALGGISLTTVAKMVKKVNKQQFKKGGELGDEEK